MTCEKCGCCEAYVCCGEQWTMCLWCADGVKCPNAARKAKQAAATKAAAVAAPPFHDHGLMHFASVSKVSRAYRVPAHIESTRPIPATHSTNGDGMPKNNIEDLRNDLFDILRSLKGEVKPIEIERAKAAVAVAGKIIDTGKLEVAVMKKVDQAPLTGFFNAPAPALNPPHENSKPQLTNGKAI